MSRFSSRANRARLAVWLTATALALTAVQVTGVGDPSEGSFSAAGLLPAPTLTAPPQGVAPPPVVLQPNPSAPPRRTTRSTIPRKPGRARASEGKATRGSDAATSGLGSARRTPTRAGKYGGRDISWPQCPSNVGIPDLRGLEQPMPDPWVRFVIIGLTNGRAFTPNPCIDRHVRWVKQHKVWASAYAFAAYPSDSQLRRYRASGPFSARRFDGKLSNAGYAAARFNLRTLRRSGLQTPHIWLDVEPSSSRPWSGRPDWNRAVLRGWVRAYRDAGYSTGVYSTPFLWRDIMGDKKLGLPEWRTAGPRSKGEAREKCGSESIQGGRAYVAQWYDSKRDYNLMCPGRDGDRTMKRFFHKH